MSSAAFLKSITEGVVLSVKLQPRASCNHIGELAGPELRIRVMAPPVDSAANEALLRLLSEKLQCPRGAVELIRGRTSRHKQVLVRSLTAEAVLQRLRDC